MSAYNHTEYQVGHVGRGGGGSDIYYVQSSITFSLMHCKLGLHSVLKAHTLAHTKHPNISAMHYCIGNSLSSLFTQTRYHILVEWETLANFGEAYNLANSERITNETLANACACAYGANEAFKKIQL